jgi:predicted XRE-type DNA-binding protein
MLMKSKTTAVTRSSGNVFADVNLPHPDSLHLKARLTQLIVRVIKGRGWTQQQAADVLGVKQPEVSELCRGQRLDHYSVERLLHFLSNLEQKVTITISSRELPREEFTISASDVQKNFR